MNPLRYFKYKNIKTLDQIRNLKPKHFEEYLLFSFTKLGYVATIVNRTSNGDLEISLTKNGKTHTVRCNAWTGNKIPLGEIRDLFTSTGYIIQTSTLILDGEMPNYTTA